VGNGALSADKTSDLAAAKSCCDNLDAALILAASKVCAKVKLPGIAGPERGAVWANNDKLLKQKA
jgi:hypothetical protein